MGLSKLVLLSWRNLWRNTRRTMITLASVAFAVFLAVLFTGLQDANWEDIINTAARLGGGHVTLQHPEYLDKPALSRTVVVPPDALAQARALAHVTKVVPRVVGQLMLSTAADSAGAAFVAYDPAGEDATTLSVLDALTAGSLFTSTDQKGIVLGARLAQNLDAEMGSKVVYTATDRNGEIVSALARVTGIVRTGSPSVDLGLCFLPLGSVRKVLGYGPHESTQVAVFLDDQRRSAAVSHQLNGMVTDAVALGWKETLPDLDNLIALKKGGMVFFEILILVLCAAGIFNTLFVSVMERLREFGIMVALGMTPRRLFVMIMLESLWMALVGLVVAAVVTAWPYHYLNTIGIDLTKAAGVERTDVAGVGMSMVMRVGIYPENAVIIALAAVLATLAAGLYPAWRAGRVEPVETIKLV